jgi:Luciferase-like monooxygenase/NMT1/THI5 like
LKEIRAMSVEFIGFIAARDQSETRPQRGPAIDLDYVTTVARAHEAAGFDRVLVAHHSTGPDAVLLAAHAAAAPRLKLMIAHRPGFIAPTYAARLFATLDQITGGRVAIHVISGGSDAEQRQDGDFLDHAARYQRTDEWLQILRSAWTSQMPFDFSGEHFGVERGFSEVRPVQQPHPPIYFGGASDVAIGVAAGAALPLIGAGRAVFATNRPRLAPGLWERSICRTALVAPVVLPSPTKLKLTWNANAVCTVGVPTALQKGSFERHNLDVELVNFGGSTDQLLEAIATGKADGGVGMALRWLKPLEMGFDVKIAAGIHGGCVRLWVAPGSDVKNLADLRGKAIGVTDMAAPDRNFFSIMLQKAGIDPGASFAVLVVAEMLGVKSGLGWYLQWAQGWAAYANMYAVLLLMAAMCSALITLLFRLRDRLLAWQKGMVQW